MLDVVYAGGLRTEARKEGEPHSHFGDAHRMMPLCKPGVRRRVRRTPISTIESFGRKINRFLQRWLEMVYGHNT